MTKYSPPWRKGLKLWLAAATISLQLVLVTLAFRTPFLTFAIPLLPSVIVLASERDFESMAKKLSGSGVQATSPAVLTGKSGIKHEFSMAVGGSLAKPKVVVDEALSVKEVTELKVLAFYVKVFDVGPEKAILCVSPRLDARAKTLAKEYKITVLENEQPRKLIPMAGDAIKGFLAGR
ncbi:MAG TPA: hypothetical protein VKF15_00320 [Nitrososphaerales archaeon]|nr:hypothetical protein [Nitrososphaerales archaeon]